jgi:hypothetical protein
MTQRSLRGFIPILVVAALTVACTSTPTTEEEETKVRVELDTVQQKLCPGGYYTYYNPCQYSADGPYLRCNSYGCWCSWY